MSFHKDIDAEPIPFHSLTSDRICFGCGEKLNKFVVRYDGYAEPSLMKSIFMHPECASEMAQRIICDTWPNRRLK